MTRNSFSLIPHPMHGCSPPHLIEIYGSVLRRHGLLQIEYQIRDPENVTLWPGTGIDPTKYWQHTCLEVFIGTEDGPAYTEYNFSPPNNWHNYEFESYRSAKPTTDCHYPSPELQFNQESEYSTLSALIPLPSFIINDTLCLAISAVIENQSHQLFYFALNHPFEKPDFHHRDGFTLFSAPPK